jgi:hypothetical protein
VLWGSRASRSLKQLRPEIDRIIRDLESTKEPPERKMLLRKLRALLDETDQNLKRG